MPRVVWQLKGNIAPLDLDSASVDSVYEYIQKSVERALLSGQKLVRENKTIDIYFYDQFSPNYRVFD